MSRVQDFSALIRPRNPDRFLKGCDNGSCFFLNSVAGSYTGYLRICLGLKEV